MLEDLALRWVLEVILLTNDLGIEHGIFLAKRSRPQTTYHSNSSIYSIPPSIGAGKKVAW